ncbi:MAG: CoA transferase, partial [Actinomycetota bacterium]|nr:CoA transferase [Actinomycetota bacterium]
MLGHVRVVDLTGERGAFAGFLLAQFGAEVVLVEPTGGRPRDAIFDSFHRGKRSVIVSAADDLDRLVADADVVISDHSIGLLVPTLVTDLARWRQRHPSLITVSITPFGSDGPKADWLATDLTLVASSGQMAVTGDGDRPPVRISVPQTWCHAGAQAAVGALVALQHRHQTGLGQHVDVSAQQAACESAVPAILVSTAGLAPVERVAGGAKVGPQLLRWVYECADGWAIITVAFGQMIGPKVAKFMRWVFDEGFCDAALRDADYIDFALHIQQGVRPLSDLDHLMEVIGTFAKTKTKAELLQRGLDEGLLLAPVNNIDDVLTSPQLASRDFWERHPDAGMPSGEICYPGPVVKSSAVPTEPLGAPAAPGAHTARYLGAGGVRPPSDVSGHSGASIAGREVPPLDGLKVCDLMWVAAGPLTTKILAHWGATVVRVESVNRPCLLRQALGHLADVPDQE